MTDHKHLKALIRSRMARTGERYSTARMHIAARRPGLVEAAVIRAHDRHCMVVRFLPDGSGLITGGFGGQARRWSAPGWDLSAELTGHTSSVNGVAFDRTGSRAVTISSDSTVRVWEGTDELRLLGRHRGVVSGVDVSPDGAWAATTAHDGRLRLWAIAERREEAEIAIGGRPGGVSFHPVEPHLAVAAESGPLVVTTEGETVLRLGSGDGAASTGVKWTQDGELLVCATADGHVRIWSVSDGEVVRDLALAEDGWMPFAVGADGRLLAVGWPHHVGLWWADDEEPATVIDGLPRGVYSVDISPDSGALAAAGADGRVRIWDIE